MKTIAMMLLLVAGCAVVDTPSPTTTQGFQDCNPITCAGGAGGGGGTGSAATCETLDCSTDSQCRTTCNNQQAECLRICNGTQCTGSCLDWGSPNP